MEPPKRLGDLLWPPALVRTGPAFKGAELEEVLLPALAPLSFKHKDDQVRLGRTTIWEEQENGDVIPFGQKLFLVDGEEFPVLELRHLEITAAVAAPQEHASA
jgi:type VI secretion system protein ImpE